MLSILKSGESFSDAGIDKPVFLTEYYEMYFLLLFGTNLKIFTKRTKTC